MSSKNAFANATVAASFAAALTMIALKHTLAWR